MHQSKPYRKCVGLVIINKDNKIFVGKRIDSNLNAWQMPQGGIETGENPLVAGLREMEEEIGTKNVEYLDEINIKTKNPEFIDWKWESHKNLPSLAVPFKRDIYLKVIAGFKKYIS